MEIALCKDAVPAHTTVYKVKPHSHNSLDSQIELWLKDGVIVPALSPWVTPFVQAAKKDNSTRWAIDYRELTKCITNLVESLAWSEVFSSFLFSNWPLTTGPQRLNHVLKQLCFFFSLSCCNQWHYSCSGPNKIHPDPARLLPGAWDRSQISSQISRVSGSELRLPLIGTLISDIAMRCQTVFLKQRSSRF